MGWRARSLLAVFCVACTASPEPEPSPSALLADQSAEFAARVAERRARELQQLIAIDQQSLELAERTEKATRNLYDAGRVPQADLLQAQEQSQRCRAQLATHEQELAELRSGQVR